MIVTPRARDGQAQHALRDGVDLFIGHIQLELLPITRVVALRSQRQVTRRNHIERLLGGIRRGQQVTRQLLGQELVVGLVFLERLHDPIAIAPSMRVRDIRFLARALGVARHIQPMPTEAFAIRGRRQEPVDHGLVRLRRAIRFKGRVVLGVRRQARQIQCHTPQPRALVSILYRPHAFGFHRRVQEAVDGIR